MSDDLGVPTEERVRRSVGRTLGNLSFVLILLGVIVGWGYTGFYQLSPGEAAVILRFGAFDRIIANPGPGLHLPVPFEYHEVVAVSTVKQAEFGYQEGVAESTSPDELFEARIQTRDNNIVHMGFAVQYRIKNAFQARYRVEDPDVLLGDASQAAVREVVGRTTIDEVLTEARGEVQVEAAEILQMILDRYEAGLEITSLELQEVQPPEAVRAAFDDVLAALQDKDRARNEAEGYANEVIPEARAEATERREAAGAYRDAKIALATGEATRFSALVVEYRRAPKVTRQRLYLETMEDVLPDVEKVIIDKGTTSVIPYLPLGRNAREPRADR